MKKMLLSITLALLTATAALAQCDKTVVYYSDKQERVDAAGNMVDGKSEVLTIEFTRDKITVNKEDKPGAATANIKTVSCQWTSIYKEGKASYEVDFMEDGNRLVSSGTVTVEGKEGKLILLVDTSRPDGKKIKVYINKYEEK